MTSFDDLQLSPAKNYKVFLVEEGDEDRERVITGLAKNVELKCEPSYSNVEVDSMLASVRVFQDSAEYTVVLDMIPRENGTVFTMENFNVPELTPVEDLGDEDSIYE